MQTMTPPLSNVAETTAVPSAEQSARSGIVPFVRRHDVAILFVVLFGVYLWFDLVWHAIDGRPPRWDEGHTLMISEHSYQALQKGEVLTALSLKNVSNTKPGMLPFLSALSYFVVGDSWIRATILANAAAMLVILFVLLQAGREFFGGAAVGAAAFLCFCNMDAVLTWSGYYQTDLPMTGAVCATIWLCWTIDRRGFTSRGLAVLLAVVVAVGMGIKHLYVLFVTAPLALFVGRAVLQGWKPPRVWLRQRGFLFVCLAAGILLGTAYHLLNIHILKEQIARSKNAVRTGGIGSPTAVWEVFIHLMTFFKPKIWCGLFVVSFLWALLAGRWRILFPALCVIGGFAGVTYVSSWPMSYYFLPIIPAALLVAFGALGLPLPIRGKADNVFKSLRGIAVAGLLVFLLLRYSENRLGTQNIFRVARWTPAVLSSFGQWTTNPMADKDYWTGANVDGNAALLPYPHHWPVEEFMQVLEDQLKTLPANRSYVLLYCTGAHEWMTDEFGRYQIKKRRLTDRLQLAQFFDVPPNKTPVQIMADYDFVILKTGKCMKGDFYGAPWGPGFQKFVDGLTGNGYAGLKEAGFEPLARRELPDGSEGSLWMSTRRTHEAPRS